MNRYLISLLLILARTTLFSQTSLDLETIRKTTLDTGSIFSYTSLIKEFKHDPTLLDIGSGTIVYYGKLFTKDYKPYNFRPDEIEFGNLISRRKFKQAIIKGEEILESDPANLEILFKLFVCYNQVNAKEKSDQLKSKIDLLASSIRAHGSGESKDNSLKVISIGDEYAMMAIMGITGLSRYSSPSGSSTFDTWRAKDSKGNRIDFYVELINNYESSTNGKK